MRRILWICLIVAMASTGVLAQGRGEGGGGPLQQAHCQRSP